MVVEHRPVVAVGSIPVVVDHLDGSTLAVVVEGHRAVGGSIPVVVVGHHKLVVEDGCSH